jgi:cytosine/adenosine deaminase-related metal-dependent hydrolase
MLGRGINVAIGTDSCASSPDLNLVDDLRLLHRLAAEMPPMQLWEMATTRAARAVGLPDVGVIRTGCGADFVAFACRSDDPLREILERDILPSGVWVGGRKLG